MSQKLHIALCEDSPQDAAVLQQLLTQFAKPCEIEVFSSGEDFLQSNPATRFHLIFLDIYMEQSNGIEIARHIREFNSDVAIVFTTVSEDFALAGYRLNALQYLTKPIEPQAIQDVIVKYRLLQRAKEAAFIRLPLDSGQKDIPIDSIMYIEVYGYHSHIHLPNEILKVKLSLDMIHSLLPGSNFLRCHRSYLVNLAYIQEVGKDILMKNGDTVYVRRGDSKKCADAYMEYLLDNERN